MPLVRCDRPLPSKKPKIVTNKNILETSAYKVKSKPQLYHQTDLELSDMLVL